MPLTRVPFPFIDLVIMLLFKYFGATLLGTAAVMLTFIAHTKATDDANLKCEPKVKTCLKELKKERVEQCQIFMDKVLQCAKAECTSSEQKAYIIESLNVTICQQCGRTGICSYEEMMNESVGEGDDATEEGGQIITQENLLQEIGKSSNSGATLPASAVVVLLSALKTAWAFCM